MHFLWAAKRFIVPVSVVELEQQVKHKAWSREAVPMFYTICTGASEARRCVNGETNRLHTMNEFLSFRACYPSDKLW